MNVRYKFADGTAGFGELQIRGQELNGLADAEHIYYDMNAGKPGGEIYGDTYEVLKKIGKNKAYEEYIKDTYKALRLKELGIETELPKIGEYGICNTEGKPLETEELNAISKEGLERAIENVKKAKAAQQH